MRLRVSPEQAATMWRRQYARTDFWWWITMMVFAGHVIARVTGQHGIADFLLYAQAAILTYVMVTGFYVYWKTGGRA